MILIDPYGKYGVIGRKNNQQGSHWPWSKHGLYVELVHPTIIIPLIDTYRSFIVSILTSILMTILIRKQPM